MSRSIGAAQSAFPVPTKSRNIAIRSDYEEIAADVDELTLKSWLANNPGWNEQQWTRIVAENHDLIRDVALEALKQKQEKSMTSAGI